MKIIIFNDTVSGHHLEYLHHLYMMAREDKKNIYIFSLPQSFIGVKDKWEWPESPSISFDLFEDIAYKSTSSPIGQIAGSYKLCKCLKTQVMKHHADAVFTNSIIGFVPCAPLLLPRKLKLSGIIYRIYLYNDSASSLITKLLNRFKYTVMSKFNVFHKVFILNDSESAETLNRIYHTKKFVHLEDPFVPLSSSNIIDIRKEYNIDQSKKVFIHFGGLARRKGTIKILDSIALLNEEEKNKFAFIFAGKIYDDIREEFYTKYNELKDKVQIILKDEFCSYDFLASLCSCCDAIVCPYQDASLSSGMLGYASQFNKKVIMPNHGLLGKLMKKYKLGYLLESNDSYSLYKSYLFTNNNTIDVSTNDYCKVNCVDNFIATISTNIK